MDLYGKNTDEIRTQYKSRFDGLQVMYGNALRSWKDQAQAKGDLKATKAAIAEMDRFATARCMPAETAADEMPEIRALQDAYVLQFSKLEAELLARLIDLSVKYEQVLDRLQKDLTRVLKLDEATAVLEERQKVSDTLNDYHMRRAVLLGGQAERQAGSGDAQNPDLAQNKEVSATPAPVKATAPLAGMGEPVPGGPGKKVTVYVEAKTVGRGGNTKSSYDKVRNMTCEVSVRMTSFGMQNAPAKVIVFFVGRDRGGSLLVTDRQEREVTLDTARGWLGSFTSKDIRENSSYHCFDYGKNDGRWFDGVKLQGWIAQVWSGGQLAGKAASLNQWLKYGESQDVAKEIGLMLVE